MKILWISPTPSHPQNAGNRAHIYALAKEVLEAGHEVTFVWYGQESAPEEAQEEMKQFWTHYYFIPHRLRDRKKSKGNMWGIDDWFNTDIESTIRFLQAQESFDAVYCEYVFFSKVLTLFPQNVLKILNCHDRMSGRAELLAKNGIEPDFFYTTADEEKKALDRADLVLAIQEEEKIFFESLTSKAVMELGYPVDVCEVEVEPYDGILRIGYLGSNNSLNRKSVEMIVELVKEIPGLSEKLTLVLAGTICNGIKDYDFIDKMGIIETEYEFYEQIDLAINPMIDGTGLKIKTLSAIRHQAPFLSTESGSKGLEIEFSEHCRETLEEMVQDIENIINKPEMWLELLREESKRLLRGYQNRQTLQMGHLLRAIDSTSVRHIRKKRVLIVTDIAFWEAGVGSHSRILSMCLALQEKFALTVFFYGSIYEQRLEQIEQAGLTCEVVSYKSYEEKAKSLNVLLTSPNLESLKNKRHEIFAKTLKMFLDSREYFDTIVIEYLWLAYVRDVIGYNALTILDSHDLMAYREYRFVSEGLKTSISLTFAQELEIIERFNAVIAIQHEEASLLSKTLTSTIPLCCPHGTEIVEKTKRRNKKKFVEIGFVGADSDANIHAIQWFLEQIWPVVRSLSIRLNIYGKVCQKLALKDEKILLHGLVPNLELAYSNCDFMINPMIHGGGIKIKSIEAMAHGLALIASPEGAVGIQKPEQSGVIVAKTRQEFIDAVILLSTNSELCTQMGLDAKSSAKQQFSREECFAPLVELIGSI